MKAFKAIVITGAVLALAGPAFAGRDLSQIVQQEQAVKKLRASQGLAGPTGPQGQAGPTTQRGPAAYNIGHPSERVRR